MKKFILTISIFFCLAGNAFAVLPLILPIIGIGVGALIGGGIMTGVLYGLLPQAATVANSGNIARPANAQWINLADINLPSPPVQSKEITADISLEKFKQLASDAQKYPLTNAILTKPEFDPWDGVTQLVSGQTKGIDGKTVRIDSTPVPGGYSMTPQGFTWYNNAYGQMLYSIGPQDGGRYYIFTVNTTTVPNPTRPSTDDEIQDSLSTLPLSLFPEPVETAYQAEIDKMLQDPDYVPSFSDAETGLPWIPPPDSQTLSLGEIAAENVKRNAEIAKTAALDSAAAATTAAQTAATGAAAGVVSAQGSLDAATIAAAADPNNWAAQQIKAQAAADLIKAQNAAGLANIASAGAQAAEDKLKAEQAKNEEEKLAEGPAVGENSVFASGGDSDKPVAKGILGLLTEIASSSPLASIIQSFTVSTSDSACIVPVGDVYGSDMNFDVCRWEMWLSACGGILVIFSHAYAVKVVAGGW